MELKDVLEEIRTKPVVPLWPHLGKLLDLSRGSVYASAARNEIDVIRIGRSIKAVTAPLRKRLGLDGVAVPMPGSGAESVGLAEPRVPCKTEAPAGAPHKGSRQAAIPPSPTSSPASPPSPNSQKEE
jgi:hypothetical protein